MPSVIQGLFLALIFNLFKEKLEYTFLKYGKKKGKVHPRTGHECPEGE
jgi:hypothetical protein